MHCFTFYPTPFLYRKKNFVAMNATEQIMMIDRK